jgi:hypothetical protein
MAAAFGWIDTVPPQLNRLSAYRSRGTAIRPLPPASGDVIEVERAMSASATAVRKSFLDNH